MMSKKDYEAIADIIVDNFLVAELREHHPFLDELCDYFKLYNPKFNKDRFLDKCLNGWAIRPKGPPLSRAEKEVLK